MSTKSKISAPGGSEVATTLTSEGASSSHPVNAVSEAGPKLDSRLAILRDGTRLPLSREGYTRLRAML